ncbi:RNA polymerase sigma-70 factor (family 1) [Pedobacter africanus]|uniref:RNA polymerase sigma-70 factor (ECF subfamily) n=1 Tax=Pedobacter africanus TaxID=151894 RepID=A0ACC6KU54_9SPHI|nr:RNA polymerase sigma-70 factor [Pedobacter africanus]MDR6782766.1 RNA polymerase sigma-70 factor (ECF subfamily) [Pedobacter africanus]
MAQENGGIITPDQFESFVKDNYRFLCLVAFRHVGDMDVAKDMVQDFFLDFWNRRDRLNIQTSLSAYASRAIKYLCMAYKNKQRPTISLDEHSLEIEGFDAGADLDHLLKNEMMHKRLEQAIDKLPVERQKIFLLSNKEGLTYQQIADRLDISINTVKTQIKKAYAFIREDMGDLTVLAILLSSIKNF